MRAGMKLCERAESQLSPGRDTGSVRSSSQTFGILDDNCIPVSDDISSFVWGSYFVIPVSLLIWNEVPVKMWVKFLSIGFRALSLENQNSHFFLWCFLSAVFLEFWWVYPVTRFFLSVLSVVQHEWDILGTFCFGYLCFSGIKWLNRKVKVNEIIYISSAESCICMTFWVSFIIYELNI